MAAAESAKSNDMMGLAASAHCLKLVEYVLGM